MAPRLDSILSEPAPKRRVADRSDETPAQGLSLELRDRVARQRELLLLRKLTSQGLDCDDNAGGKSGLVARPEVVRAALQSVARRIVCATC